LRGNKGWVAEKNFPGAQSIMDALSKRPGTHLPAAWLRKEGKASPDLMALSLLLHPLLFQWNGFIEIIPVKSF
jgi:hypothetical protein